MAVEGNIFGLPGIKITLLDMGSLGTAVTEWLNGRARRDLDRRDRLIADLEMARVIVTELERFFTERMSDFQKPEVVNDPASLRAAVEKTEEYLSAMDLLPQLNQLNGQLEGQSAMREFAKQEIALTEVWQSLTAFRRTLGEGRISGVGLAHLSQAIYTANEVLEGRVNSEALMTFAKTAHRTLDRKPVERAEHAIGSAIGQLKGTR